MYIYTIIYQYNNISISIYIYIRIINPPSYLFAKHSPFFPSSPQRCCPPASRGPVEIRWKRPCHCRPGTGTRWSPVGRNGRSWDGWGRLLGMGQSIYGAQCLVLRRRVSKGHEIWRGEIDSWLSRALSNTDMTLWTNGFSANSATSAHTEIFKIELRSLVLLVSCSHGHVLRNLGGLHPLTPPHPSKRRHWASVLLRSRWDRAVRLHPTIATSGCYT